MIINTSELEGVSLEYSVAITQGWMLDPLRPPAEGQLVPVGQRATSSNATLVKWLAYSTEWTQGGPLIEQHLITVTPHPVDIGPATDTYWAAFKVPYGVDTYPKERWGKPSYGKTYLVAAMRAIVASKLGDEVSVPDALL